MVVVVVVVGAALLVVGSPLPLPLCVLLLLGCSPRWAVAVGAGAPLTAGLHFWAGRLFGLVGVLASERLYWNWVVPVGVPRARRRCILRSFGGPVGCTPSWPSGGSAGRAGPPFWTSSAPLDRTSGTSCTLMCHTIGCPCVRGPTGLTNRVSSMPMYPCIIGWVLVIKTKGMGNVGRFVCPGVCLTAKIAQMPAGMAWATMASEGPTQAVCPETRAARGGCRWLPRAWHLGRCRRLVWAGVRLTCPLLLRPGLRLLFVGCQLVVWWVAVVVAHWCCGASSLARLVGCHCCSHQWAAWWPLCACVLCLLSVL